MLTISSKILSWVLNKFAEKVAALKVWLSFKRIYGPSPIPIARDNFFVCALMRNDSIFIDSFVSHYSSLGASHIFLIDNGSIDESIARASKYKNVTVYTTNASFLKSQSLIRRIFLKRYLWGNWVVFVDIDELLRFPCDDTHKFSEILKYCNNNGYNAISACMLDVYTLNERGRFFPSDSVEDYRYCEVHSIEKTKYPLDRHIAKGNIVSSLDAALYSGGIRKKLSPSGNFWLTKHPVMLLRDDLVPFTHPHFCSGATLADFQCALIHLKFFSDFRTRLSNSINLASRSRAWIEENQLISTGAQSLENLDLTDSTEITNFSVLYDCRLFIESVKLKEFLVRSCK